MAVDPAGMGIEDIERLINIVFEDSDSDAEYEVPIDQVPDLPPTRGRGRRQRGGGGGGRRGGGGGGAGRGRGRGRGRGGGARGDGGLLVM